MNEKIKQWQEEATEEFAKELSQKVRRFAGNGQYEEVQEQQNAYLDGVETAIGMMYIDLTGTPKTKGMLATLLTHIATQAIKARDAEIVGMVDKKIEALDFTSKQTAVTDNRNYLVAMNTLKEFREVLTAIKGLTSEDKGE